MKYKKIKYIKYCLNDLLNGMDVYHIIVKQDNLNSTCCCWTPRVDSLDITGGHASDDKAPAQCIPYHLENKMYRKVSVE